MKGRENARCAVKVLLGVEPSCLINSYVGPRIQAAALPLKAGPFKQAGDNRTAAVASPANAPEHVPPRALSGDPSPARKKKLPKVQE